MSNSEDPNQPNQSSETAETAKQALSGGLASVMALKNSNPKAFMGGAAALLVVFIFFLSMMGGDDAPVITSPGGAPAKAIEIGGKYSLKSPNSYDATARVQLVAVPGAIAAFDEAEDGEKNPCRKVLQGTKVSIVNLQDAYGRKNTFAQVKIEEGECKDKDGWVLAINLQ